ncbi:MAG: hypothetical protein J6R47_01080 [Acholeplasmatales bacterium]|nr:hypothetical protein [Acholeplasmatales bacterium]
MINPGALKENIKHEIEASKKSGENAFRCTYQLAETIIEYIEQEIALRNSIEGETSKIVNYFAEDLKSLENHMSDYFMYSTYEQETARRKARLEASFHLCSAIDKTLNGEKK